MKKVIILYSTALLVFISLSCNRKTTEISFSEKTREPVLKETFSDTIQYNIAFSRKNERDKFEESLKTLLSSYDFDSVSMDSADNIFNINLYRYKHAEKKEPPSDSLLKIKKDSIYEETITRKKTEIQVQPGGDISIYSSRGFLDNSFKKLLLPDNAVKIDTIIDTFNINEKTLTDKKEQDYSLINIQTRHPGRLSININSSSRTTSGRAIDAMGLINYWNEFVKDYPAQGKAIFRYVEGIEDYIQGRETVISGIRMNNSRSITLKISQEDRWAAHRLDCRQLLPPSAKAGYYYISNTGKNKIVLKPNPDLYGKSVFLDKISITLGGDPNPFVSFSLGKYDFITVSNQKELSYAQNSKNSSLKIIKLQPERYFISLVNAPDRTRTYLSEIIDRETLMKSSAIEEARLISYIGSDNSRYVKYNNSTPPEPGSGISILFIKDDPVSLKIAEKIFADISQTDLKCSLAGKSRKEYERALISGKHTCIIGWVSQSILDDRSEKLRMATMWFRDVTDESLRLSDYSEIPLFSLSRYAVLKKYVSVPQNRPYMIHLE